MKIFLASDHAAYWQKKYLVEALEASYQIEDLGAGSDESVNYADFAVKLARSVQLDKDSVGILLCGSGIGVSMAANRFKGIRAALCRDVEDAKLSRQHNNANVLCLAGRKIPEDELLSIAKAWLNEEFEGGRHQARIDTFNSLGE